MRRALCTTAAVLTLFSVTTAGAVDPDAVRERKQHQPGVKEEPAPTPTPTPAQQAAALSDAFKKFATAHMLMWRTSPSGVTMIMGQFASPQHCAEARKLLRRQVVRLGWGRAECVEVMLP